MLGYAPRHVPLRHSIRRHYLGRPVAVIVERSIRNRGAASTDCKKRPLKPGGVFHSTMVILFGAELLVVTSLAAVPLARTAPGKFGIDRIQDLPLVQ